VVGLGALGHHFVAQDHHAAVLHLEFALLQQGVAQEFVQLVTVGHALQTTGTAVHGGIGHVHAGILRAGLLLPLHIPLLVQQGPARQQQDGKAEWTQAQTKRKWETAQ